MNLAYTFSTLYARLHPERKASSAERRRVVPYAEKPLLFGLIAFIIAAASLGLFMLFSPISCRPIGTDPMAFAASSSVNYYGSKYIETVCETELKLHPRGGFSTLAVGLIVAGICLVVSNSVCLLKLNRLHAIARGDLYAECMRGRAPEKWETPQRFARFWLCFFASKALMTVISAGSFVYYALHLAGRETATRTHDGILHGGSLLSRYGALCDGASIHFEDSFPGRYRCHITREPVMIYLQSQVYAFGGALLLIMLAMLGALAAFFGDYRKWQHEAALQRNRPGSRLSPGDGPDASLVRSLRVAVRVSIGYFSAEPPDGLPDLLAKVIVGKAPTKRSWERWWAACSPLTSRCRAKWPICCTP